MVGTRFKLKSSGMKATSSAFISLVLLMATQVAKPNISEVAARNDETAYLGGLAQDMVR